MGSSPRVWGQDNDGEWYLGVPRIIPTRMGTSCVVLLLLYHTRGSSPRVWGQVITPSLEYHHLGIIPTRMGTSLLLSRRQQGCRDHPHAYGDKPRYLQR